MGPIPCSPHTQVVLGGMFFSCQKHWSMVLAMPRSGVRSPRAGPQDPWGSFPTQNILGSLWSSAWTLMAEQLLLHSEDKTPKVRLSLFPDPHSHPCLTQNIPGIFTSLGEMTGENPKPSVKPIQSLAMVQAGSDSFCERQFLIPRAGCPMGLAPVPFGYQLGNPDSKREF